MKAGAMTPAFIHSSQSGSANDGRLILPLGAARIWRVEVAEAERRGGGDERAHDVVAHGGAQEQAEVVVDVGGEFRDVLGGSHEVSEGVSGQPHEEQFTSAEVVAELEVDPRVRL